MGATWQQALDEFLRPGALLVGIGNRLRGDDAFGPMLTDRLRGATSWSVRDAGETPENEIGRIAALGPERVLLLDAVNWGAGPGGIAFFPIHTVPWQGVSTHGMSLRLFAEVLAARTGCWVALVGVQPKCTRIGAPLSSEVAESLDCVAGYLMNTTARRGSPGDRP